MEKNQVMVYSFDNDQAADTSIIQMDASIEECGSTRFRYTVPTGARFILSKTNESVEHFLNILNEGNCTIHIFAVHLENDEITGSRVTLPPNTRLASFKSPLQADRVVFISEQDGDSCIISFCIVGI